MALIIHKGVDLQEIYTTESGVIIFPETFMRGKVSSSMLLLA